MKHYTPLLLSLSLFIASLLGYSYIFIGLQNNISQLATIEADIQEVSVRDETAQSMSTFLSNIGTLRSSIDRYVVDEGGVINAIELIEQTARRESVTLSLSSVTAVAQDSWQSHEGVEISFSASGPFSNMMGLVGAIESLPLASKVSKVSLEASTKGEWFGVFTVFFIKEKI